VQLFAQSGGKLRYDSAQAAFQPVQASERCRAAGSAAGEWSLRGCIDTGFEAGALAASALGLQRPETPRWEIPIESDYRVTPLWRVPASRVRSGKQWVDFHNDVTVDDIALAARENFHSVEHLKRYTTLGMAPDQGKTSNVNGLAVLGECTGRAPDEVGTTTFRPPFTPIRFGLIAGRDRGGSFRPSRLLPTDRLQQGHGAHMADYGAWRRPAVYTRGGETVEASLTREVGAVRNAVGILDYSPLGKIEVAGPDALTFLDRMVATNLQTLKVGRTRYSLTLTDGGAITDDGIISRLAEDRYLVGTTSGAADRIFSLLDEWHQRECPELEVDILNVTTQWAVLMLSGPGARDVLAGAEPDIDLSPAVFPHMAVREGRVGGVSTRISRVSFTGEVSFEVAVPTGYAASLWQHFFASARAVELTPIGIEALDILRLEKGFIHIGTDTDGTTIPDDVGYGSMTRGKARDFLGQRSLALPDMMRSDRLQLVGLKPLDHERPLAVGAQLVHTADTKSCSGLGHVTSSAWSPTLATPLALAMLAGGRGRFGERLHAWANGQFRPVEVIEPRRYDPAGARLSG